MDALFESRVEWEHAGTGWRDGDLAWLGLVISVVSALVVVGLVWWLIG